MTEYMSAYQVRNITLECSLCHTKIQALVEAPKHWVPTGDTLTYRCQVCTGPIRYESKSGDSLIKAFGRWGFRPQGSFTYYYAPTPQEALLFCDNPESIKELTIQFTGSNV